MDLEKLRLFALVAELGSFTRAAVMRDVAQSIVSRHVAALERECGGALFHRTGHGVCVTPLGERILPRVRALIGDADQLSNDIRSTAGIPVGEVRVGLIPSATHPLINVLFRRLQTEFPGVRLRVYDGSDGQLEEWLSGGQIDIGVLYSKSRDSTRTSHRLTRIAAHLVGGAGDPITRLPTVEFIRLDGLPLVLAGLPSGVRSILEQHCRRRRISLNVVIEADSLAVQKDLVADGNAYTILSPHAVYREVEAGRLQASKIVHPMIERTIVLKTTTHHPFTQAGRIVAQFIRRIIEEGPEARIWSDQAGFRRPTARQRR